MCKHAHAHTHNLMSFVAFRIGTQHKQTTMAYKKTELKLTTLSNKTEAYEECTNTQPHIIITHEYRKKIK